MPRTSEGLLLYAALKADVDLHRAKAQAVVVALDRVTADLRALLVELELAGKPKGPEPGP